MNILITQEQLKVIIGEGRYSNPLFFKLASDLFDEFFNYIKNPLEKNNFCEIIRNITKNPEIGYRELRSRHLEPNYEFSVNKIVKKNTLGEYLKLIDKNNKNLNSFIVEIYEDKLDAFFNVSLGIKKTKEAEATINFYEDKLNYFIIKLYGDSFITYELKNKSYDNSEILQIILGLKNKLVSFITHELQHVYDAFNSPESMDKEKKVKSDKDFYHFYNKILKDDLSKIKFDENDPEEDERIKWLIKYHFEKREIWARIQQFFNSMNLENPEQLIFFYKERISGSDIIHYWAKRFVESVLMDVINKLKLDKKIEIPIDKFKRYLYKIFYQMLSYKVQLLIDEMKK